MTKKEIADLRALHERASVVRSKPRDPNEHRLQCPKCGGQHYDCSTSEERYALQLWHRALIELAPALLDTAERGAELEAENTRLREAIKPFAVMSESYEPIENDDDLPVYYVRPKIGDLRRAAAALISSAPKEG